MISTFKHFEDVNLETVTQFFNDNIENFNNVDSVLLDKIDIKTNDVNLENSEKKILFNHFSVTRTIAQISLNLFRNKTYFKDLEFDCKIILTAIEDFDDRNKYEESLKQLQDIDTISEILFKKMVVSNLTIFLIVKKLLKTKEGIMDSSDHTIPKLVLDYDQIGDSGASQIRSEFSTSISHTWKCFFCDNENDDESMKCSICDTAKNEMTSGSSNEQGGKTVTSPCRPESNTVVDKFNVSRQGDGSTINRSNSSDISMQLCPRCKKRSVNKDKYMICGFCANELYMKEMKELDVLAMSNRVDNRQDTNVGRHFEEKMECEKSSDDHSGMKMVHNGGHSNIAGNVRYVLLSEDNAMAERSNQTREIESGMSSLSICGGSEQGIDYNGVTLGLHEWSCPKCTMKNPVSNDKCTTCGIIGPNTRNNMFINTCRGCHRNDVNVKYNELCDECLSGERKLEGTDHARVTTSVTLNIGDKSPTNSDNDGPGEDKWRCTACSMINSLDVDKCVACGVDGPHFNKWICDHCKERNSYDVDKCGDCGGLGPHYDKWRCDRCTKINDKLARRCDVCDAENNGIMKCPQCHVTDINSKCDTRCRECIRGLSGGNRSGEGKEDMGDVSDIPRDDRWYCGKCARHNPYDLVMCGGCGTMGPHYDKWRCDKCTCLNEWWTSMCSACHEYQRDRHIYILATSGGGESVRDECRGKCAERGDTLCYPCIGRYYKCDNTKCKKINSNDDKFCRHCGVKRGSLLYNDNLVEYRIDGGIGKMWQCTFTECMHLNSEYYYKCTICDCPRYTLYNHRCTHCGWIHYYPGRCTKCYLVTSL